MTQANPNDTWTPKRKSLTRAQRLDVLWASGHRCHICGTIINLARGDKFEVEHVVALGIGGQESATNRRAAHVDCHAEKTSMDRKAIAKTKRIWAKHHGIPTKKKASRLTSTWVKRRIDGTVVNRATGQVIGKGGRG